MSWFLKFAFRMCLVGILLLLLTIWVCNFIIVKSTKPYLYNEVDAIPQHHVALVLGTSKRLGANQINYFYKYRIEAAAALYHNKKVKYVIVSGDNGHMNYNEPKEMKNDLIRLGVPKDRIFEDFAGFRTFDSVVRCQKVFGQQRFIVVSQAFHNERAVYIARHFGIEAIGFNAKDVSKRFAFKTYIRERLAKVKVFLDLLSGQKPKYLGDPVIIPS